MTSLFIAIGVFFAIKQLWLYFTAAMRLQEVRDTIGLTRAQTVIGTILLCEGLLLDFLVHILVGTVLFLELPAKKEYTLSARLWRLSTGPVSWRQRLALRIRVSLLDSIDPRGFHEA